MMKRNEQVPAPCAAEVECYLEKWTHMESYLAQEAALSRLFTELCPGNTDFREILIKTSLLNDFYNTNLYDVLPAARRIFELQPDERLKAGDLSLVEDMKRVVIAGKEKNLYSFASKYCRWHNSQAYPVYDSYVDEMLRYFRKRDGFCAFQNEELKVYPRFHEILSAFRRYYALEAYGLREVDLYLWLLGKTHFPKSYAGKSKKA